MSRRNPSDRLRRNRVRFREALEEITALVEAEKYTEAVVLSYQVPKLATSCLQEDDGAEQAAD